MSRFVENLRHLLNKHFTIRDEEMGEQVVSVWQAMGLDLSVERPLTIHLMLPSEESAMELAFRAEGLPAFYGASVGQVAEMNGMTTELTLTFFMLPQAEAIDTLERLITALGSDLGAMADGWSSDTVADNATRAA
jgi:hypothetical protein